MRVIGRSFRNLVKLARIARVLACHDVLILSGLPAMGALSAALRLGRRKPTGLRDGQRLASALTELGPTFIKVGQALSIRADLLGDAMVADLTDLQDRLPPFPSAQARQRVEEDLGKPLDQIFSHFDDTPVAAASIAQVHFAVTTEGRPVAVKVLRPNVEKAFARDLDLLDWLAHWAERLHPPLQRLRLVESVATLAESVRMEMDLRFEAAAAAEMADNFRDDDTLTIPAVDWQRTGARMLTLERVSGIPVDEREAIRQAGFDPTDVLRQAAESFFNMVFRDGFFHADMHPGNLFVGSDGKLIAVDFGITGRIDTTTRKALAELLLGFLTRDYRRVAEVHFEVGYVPAGQSLEVFTQACRSIAEPILGKPLHEISIARLLGHLFRITEYFSMQTQPQLLLLQKSMLVAEGVGRQLNSHVNMWDLAQPLIESWMRDNFGPAAKVKDVARTLQSTVVRLPQLVERVEQAADSLSHGITLSPQTMALLTGAGRRPSIWSWLLPWLVVVALLVYIGVVLHG